MEKEIQFIVDFPGKTYDFDYVSKLWIFHSET